MNVNLSKTKVTDVGENILAKSLKKLKNLTHMKVNISQTEVTDVSAESLAKSLEKLKNLTNINVSLGNTTFLHPLTYLQLILKLQMQVLTYWQNL